MRDRSSKSSRGMDGIAKVGLGQARVISRLSRGEARVCVIFVGALHDKLMWHENFNPTYSMLKLVVRNWILYLWSRQEGTMVVGVTHTFCDAFIWAIDSYSSQ